MTVITDKYNMLKNYNFTTQFSQQNSSVKNENFSFITSHLTYKLNSKFS
jgi:hypothetical protein